MTKLHITNDAGVADLTLKTRWEHWDAANWMTTTNKETNMKTTYVTGTISKTRSTITVEAVYQGRPDGVESLECMGRPGASRHPRKGDVLGIYTEGRAEYAVRPAK